MRKEYLFKQAVTGMKENPQVVNMYSGLLVVDLEMVCSAAAQFPNTATAV